MKKLLGALSVLVLVFCNVNGSAKKAKQKGRAARNAAQAAADAILASNLFAAAAPAAVEQATDAAQAVAVLQQLSPADQQQVVAAPSGTTAVDVKTVAALAVSAGSMTALASPQPATALVANGKPKNTPTTNLQSAGQAAASERQPVANLNSNALAVPAPLSDAEKSKAALTKEDEEKAPEQPQPGWLGSLVSSAYHRTANVVSSRVYSHRSIVTAALENGTFTQKYPQLADQLAAMNLALSDVIEKAKKPAQYREHNRLEEVLYLVQQAKKHNLILPPQYKNDIKEIVMRHSSNLEKLRDLVKTPPPAAATQPDKPQQQS